MATVGGIFYGLLTQTITRLLSFSSELALIAAFFVFFFYLVSRFLLLFSGIQTPYYSKGGRTPSMDLYENTHFHQTAQWVGKFYHYHDMALFIFLAVLSIAFLISLVIDWAGSESFGDTIQNLLYAMLPSPR
jgi:hypothetical protein